MVKIKSTDKGRKYIKVGKRKTYLPTLLKRVNKLRISSGKNPYKTIGKRNIDNILLQLMTEKSKPVVKGLKKVKRPRGRRKKIPDSGIRQKLQEAMIKIQQLEAQASKEKDANEKAKLLKQVETLKEKRDKIDEQNKLLRKNIKNIEKKENTIVDTINEISRGLSSSQISNDDFKKISDLNTELTELKTDKIVFEAKEARNERDAFMDVDWDKLMEVGEKENRKVGMDDVAKIEKERIEDAEMNKFIKEAEEDLGDLGDIPDLTDTQMDDFLKQYDPEGSPIESVSSLTSPLPSIISEVSDATLPDPPIIDIPDTKLDLRDVGNLFDEGQSPFLGEGNRFSKMKQRRNDDNKLKRLLTESKGKIPTKKEYSEMIDLSLNKSYNINMPKVLTNIIAEYSYPYNYVNDLKDIYNLYGYRAYTAKNEEDKDELMNKVRILSEEIKKAKNDPSRTIYNIPEETKTQIAQIAPYMFRNPILDLMDSKKEYLTMGDDPIDEKKELRPIDDDMEGGMLDKPEEALNNTQIENIMERYGDKFLGVVARDGGYREIPMIKPKSNGGMIYNLDKEGQSGSHWVALYYDARQGKKNSICYYDSFGRDIPREIEADIKRIVKKLKCNSHIKLKINRKVNQDKSSVSCGYLSCQFLMDMLRGKSFKSATGFNVKQNENRAEDMAERFDYIL